MKTGDILLQMAMQFALLSILSFGGINVILPDVHRFVVDVHHWLTNQEFADFFAIAQAAPGPNFLMFGLMGWKAAGPIGAIVAALSIAGPAATVAFVVGGLWHRFRGALWRRAVQLGLAPVTIGLVFSSGLVLGTAADHDWITYAITAATAVITVGSEVNPLWLFFAAGMLGVFGLV